jgi:hypothetical protein
MSLPKNRIRIKSREIKTTASRKRKKAGALHNLNYEANSAVSFSKTISRCQSEIKPLK